MGEPHHTLFFFIPLHKLVCRLFDYGSNCIATLPSCGHHLIAVECISARSTIRHSSNEYKSAAICVTVEVDGQTGSHFGDTIKPTVNALILMPCLP